MHRDEVKVFRSSVKKKREKKNLSVHMPSAVGAMRLSVLRRSGLCSPGMLGERGVMSTQMKEEK